MQTERKISLEPLRICTLSATCDLKQHHVAMRPNIMFTATGGIWYDILGPAEGYRG